MAGDYEQLLDRAAELWGIAAEYWDIWGRRHTTSAETKRTILNSLGVSTGNAEELAGAIAAREDSRLVPACVVADAGAVEVPIRTDRPLGARIELRLEDGAVHTFDADLEPGRPLRLEAPLGYHELRVAAGDRRAAAHLIVTPERAHGFDGRAAGVMIALYGLRSARNQGCGDFTDLESFIDWAVDALGAQFVGLNPLHSIHNRRPFNTSPYLPNSIFYQNFIYLDLERIEDFARSGRARRAWEQPATRAQAAALRDAPFMEYEGVAALKLRFLKLAFLEFLRERRAGSDRASAFDHFVNREGDLLERFAVWSALDEHIRRRYPEAWVWSQWPEPYRDPDSPETAFFRKKHWRAVLFWKYVQWQIDLQLAHAQQHARSRGMRIGLYHDLALATDRFGSDFWAHRPYFAAGCRVGSPPDDFSPKGQDWGFPPPRSDRHFESGYRMFAESIRRNCRHGGALRIDHVMRLFRLYWIPDGAEATGGTYVRDRSEDLVRVLALESVRNGVVIIGEDLGTVEPVVRETLARFGILSYRLLYFEKDRAGQFRLYSEYPLHALVSPTTHDLPTLAGFWSGADIESRYAAGGFPTQEQYQAALSSRAAEKQKMLELLHTLGLLPEWVPSSAADLPELTGELHSAVVGFLASTPSQLLCINQEDLTKEPDQQNLPGTTWQYPNWGRKMRFTLEQLRCEPIARDFAAMFRGWVERTGRA